MLNPSKLPGVGLTIFSHMTQLANAHGAINLSQGFPDFSPPEALVALVAEAMAAGHNQYAPMQGTAALREAIAAKVKGCYGACYDPEREITVTSGATEALFAAISAVVGPGDDAMLFDPAYDAYAPVVRLNGARPIHVTLQPPDYTIDWDRVCQALTRRTRLLVLNSPHNPSGAVLAAEDLAALESLLENTSALVVSDEVYEHIVFDGRRHESLSRRPPLAARSFVISSFGKSFHATGWKIGYCLAPAALSAEFRKIHQFLTFASCTPIQHAMAAFLPRREVWPQLGVFYQRKRDLFRSLLQGSRFRILPCRGTYFQLLDYSAISEECDLAFAERLTREHGVAAIPTSVFYHQGEDHRVLRFCFAKRDETLRQAAERLCPL
jgi:methionine aminotransferase